MFPVMIGKNYQILLVTLLVTSVCIFYGTVDSKDHRKEHPAKGNLCIAKFDTSGEPLYYSCPRPNEPEKKSYCCELDKCCDFKEYQKQMERRLRETQGKQTYIAKGAIGGALKVLFWIVFLIIALIVGCCCLAFFLCRKKKLFQGTILSGTLPPQPPGPSPYAPPSNPYMAYEWPPETAPQPPPAYPSPAYPPYPSNAAGSNQQPPYNPNFK